MLIKPLTTKKPNVSEKEDSPAKLLTQAPHVKSVASVPTAEGGDETPIDIVSELGGIDIASLPYTPRDPQGWVRKIAEVYWSDTETLIDKIVALSPMCEFNQVPGTDYHRQWLRLSKKFEWEPVELEDLPEFLLPDIESVKEGVETPTTTDTYRPFMVGMLGANRGDDELSWYLWQDQIKEGEELLDVVPFPQNRVVVNHNISAYDRRYFSCEYEQLGPSTNKYIDTRSLMQMMHGISSQAVGIYKAHVENKELGLGVPAWVSKACPSNLKDSVKFRTGRDIEKTVRTNFTKLTASELAQEMMSSENIEVTPVTVTQYCMSDVQATFELFVSLWHEARVTFITHPASWVGLTMLSGVRCYLDGLDDFILENDRRCADTKRTEIRDIIARLADNVVAQRDLNPDVTKFVALNSAVVHAKLRLKAEEQKKKNAIGICEKLEEKLKQSHGILAKLALEIQEAKHEIEKLKGDRTLTQVKKSGDSQRLAELTKERTKATTAYKKERKAYLKHLKEKESNRELALFSDAQAQINPEEIYKKERNLKEVRENIRVLKGFISENKEELAQLREKAIEAGEAIAPYLDWDYFTSGPREGQIKWYAELEAAEFSHSIRDSIYLIQFRWNGDLVYYVKNEMEEGDKGQTGTWVTDEERLPHLGGKRNLGSPICNDYYRFLLGDTPTLTSDVLTQQELLNLFKAVENTNQWVSYQSRYKEVYRKQTEWGLLTTTDTLSAGTLSMRTTGLSAVLPKRSEKIGSDVQKLISGGKGRVVLERDFAAQESKFLAMLVDCWKGRSLSTVWSKAVLTGAKADKTDIHNLVAIFCTEELKKMWEGDPEDCPVVDRHTGKNGLNFPSIYLSGRETIATGLIKDADFPPNLAYLVADIFLNYLKGPQGIALEEFAMLSRIADIPGYRTAALNRKIAHSVDRAYCDDFHTTRSNWTIQGGCTDLLHITLVVVWALCLEYEIDAFPLITVHDSLKYSVRKGDEALFERLFDFAHAVAKQCAYQGATAWTRKVRGTSAISQLWCPASDIFFEERLEREGLPSAKVAS